MFAATLTDAHHAQLDATAPRLTHFGEQAALVFSMQLRRYAPGLGALGATRFDALSRLVLQTLSGAAPYLDQPHHVRPILIDLAHYLREFGMSPRAYMAIHAAFLDTVADRVGTDRATEEAWGEAIDTMLATMMAGVHGPNRNTLPLAA